MKLELFECLTIPEALENLDKHQHTFVKNVPLTFLPDGRIERTSDILCNFSIKSDSPELCLDVEISFGHIITTCKFTKTENGIFTNKLSIPMIAIQYSPIIIRLQNNNINDNVFADHIFLNSEYRRILATYPGEIQLDDKIIGYELGVFTRHEHIISRIMNLVFVHGPSEIEKSWTTYFKNLFK